MGFHGMTLWIALTDKNTEEHSRHIRIDDGRTLLESETANRARGISANTFEGEQCGLIDGQAPAVLEHCFTCDRLQPPWSDIVAEWKPRFSHFRFRCGCQNLERRVLSQPLDVLRQHAIDLSLLKHDLGHEDMVGVLSSSPREISSVAPVPRQQSLAKSSSLRRRRQLRLVGTLLS